MKKKGLMVFKALKLIWNLGIILLGAILAIGFDKRSPSRYTALQAHILHEEGLISDAEYMKALDHDY